LRFGPAGVAMTLAQNHAGLAIISQTIAIFFASPLTTFAGLSARP
jgi:hypothetical protein